MIAKNKILAIDDEAAIRKLLKSALETDDTIVLEAATATEGIRLLATEAPFVVLLDLGLPDKDGMEVVREIRRFSQVPIIVLSARDTDSMKVDALDAGADDYLTKPFSLPELKARMRVAFRRSKSDLPEKNHSFGDVEVDLGERIVRKAGKEIHLTPIEYKLLLLLLRYQGKVLTHHQLLASVWGEAYQRQTQYLRVYMTQLRRKLEDDPSQPQFLISEPGVGYRLRLEPLEP